MLPGENRSDISILSHTTVLLVPHGRAAPSPDRQKDLHLCSSAQPPLGK